MNKNTNQKKKDGLVKFVLGFIISIGIFIGFLSLLFLFDGEIGAFFGTAVTGAGFTGLGWAARKFLSSPTKEPIDVSKVVLTIFGGAGISMIIGSILLLVDEEIEAAIGLFLFGSVFCGAGYLAYRVFRTPEGKKKILVSKISQKFKGRYGEAGERTSQQYVFVDKDIPESDIKQMQATWTNTPWTQRKDWADGKVIQEGAKTLGFLVVFTILWNMISFGITGFAFITEWKTGDIPWFMIIFPAVGIILLITTVRLLIQRKKFGISIMKLDTLPAYLGERLRANIQTGVSALDDPARSFQVKFLCAERISSRDSKGKKRVSENELWSKKQEVYAQLSESLETLNVSIYFNVPADLPPTESIPIDDRIVWRVNITSKVPGIDYAAKFEVPVYPYDQKDTTSE